MSRVNSTSYGTLVAGGAVIILSVMVLLKVMSLSLNRGDSVPPGSSLRTDPKGSKVLFRSLASIPELNVRRNYTELNQQDLPAGATMVLMGITAKTQSSEFFRRGYLHSMSKREFEALNTFITSGGRLILTMNDTLVDEAANQNFVSSEFKSSMPPGIAPPGIAPPGTTPPGTTPPGTTPPGTTPPGTTPPGTTPTGTTPPGTTPTGTTPTAPPAQPTLPGSSPSLGPKTQPPALPPKAGGQKAPAAPTPGGKPPPPPPTTNSNNMLGMQVSPFFDDPFIEKWGADYARSGLSLNDEEDQYIPTVATPASDKHGFSPQQWHSGYYFNNLSDAWSVVYTSRSHPVMVERRFGAGSIVLVSDSYFLSNQGLRRKPNGLLIKWLLGGNSTIIFNERHLNVREDTGATSLVYRYNLQWFGGTLILIAILYIWRCTTSLVPLRDTVRARGRGFVKEGIEAREGFAQLLQRNIPDTDVLKTCYEEWLRSEAKTARLDEETMEHITRIATDEEVAHNHKLISEGYRRICAYISRRRD